uniref:Uncharacterized protein n=1 Tax=Avena sativa TaxID=4498 RepID=A0ACD5XUF9_AVESA
MGQPRLGDERGVAGDAGTFPSSKRRDEAAAAEAPPPDWTSFHPDITNLIAERLLAEDVTEHMRFRLVCSHWRASTDSPRDPTLADRRFHPRRWVALCDGNGVRPVEDAAITFFHTGTGKVRRLRLPELVGHRIVGITDGLLILLHTSAAVIRVVHPFTRVVVELPHLAAFVRCVLFKQKGFTMDSVAWMNATVCVASPSSIEVVIWFPNMRVVICSQPGSKGWKIIHTRIQFSNTLPFEGGLYGVTRVGRQLVRVYPRDSDANPVVAQVPKELGHPNSCHYFLVESMGAMSVAVLHRAIERIDDPINCTLFSVDLPRRELTRVTSLGDRALFISRDRCLSVSSRDLPSISGNSVYFARPGEDPVEVYSLDDGSFESTVTIRQSQDIRKGVLPTSVRPFTLADHLATYCRHREWTRGLMFHEYCYLRPTWRELWQRIAAQDSEVTIPRLIATERDLKKLELPNLLSPARTQS